MSTKADVHPMDTLKKRLLKLLDAIPQGSSIYYVDYPVYNNGGDLLIMKGAEKFFRDNGIRVRARYSVLDFPDGLSIPSDQIIVLQGGGNFGDLYPVHQRLREKIVADYPNNRVVILPQTIYYKDEAEFEKTARIFNKHKDLHLFVRDPLSQQMAERRFVNCSIQLSPDMAHQLWPIVPAGTPDKELLCFFRTDIEKTAEQTLLEQAGRGDYMDWGTLYNRWERKAIAMTGKGLRKGIAPLPMQAFWNKYSDYLVEKAVKRFSGYESVQTSRLHGHILSCLLDKPNTLLDNSYGKNSNYYLTWTSPIQSAGLIVQTKEASS